MPVNIPLIVRQSFSLHRLPPELDNIREDQDVMARSGWPTQPILYIFAIL